MRAVMFAAHGGPEVLELVDNWPEPTADRAWSSSRCKRAA